MSKAASTKAADGLTAVDILCEATMKAAAELLAMGKYPKLSARPTNLRTSHIAGAMRQTLKCKLSYIMKEWKEALDAGLGNGWLRKMIGTQAIECATETLDICEEEL